MGTMTMELGGKVSIVCSKTGYTAELEFKLRVSIITFIFHRNNYFLIISIFQPFLGGGEFTNAISGKIRLSKEVLVTLDGHWDETVMMKDKKTGVSGILNNP